MSRDLSKRTVPFIYMLKQCYYMDLTAARTISIPSSAKVLGPVWKLRFGIQIPRRFSKNLN
jgi:hypothetical protein